MKRSEAINKIVSRLPDISHVNTTPEFLADFILSGIEELGMLPPFDEGLYMATWRFGGTGHTWEDEDEKV